MRDELFNELLESIEQASKIKQGKQRASRKQAYQVNVKHIRETTGLSQEKFAAMIGVSVRTIQNWEQGRRQPHGPSLALLKIFKGDPVSAVKALHAA